MLRNSIDRALKKIDSKWTAKRFSVQELNYLKELLNTDLPLKTCLKLIETEGNRKIIDSFIKRLERGEMIEESVFEYMPLSISIYQRSDQVIKPERSPEPGNGVRTKKKQ